MTGSKSGLASLTHNLIGSGHTAHTTLSTEIKNSCPSYTFHLKIPNSSSWFSFTCFYFSNIIFRYGVSFHCCANRCTLWNPDTHSSLKEFLYDIQYIFCAVKWKVWNCCRSNFWDWPQLSSTQLRAIFSQTISHILLFIGLEKAISCCLHIIFTL